MEIEPTELWELLEQKADVCVLDVRQVEELALSKLEGSVHIPLGELENRLDEVKALGESSATRHVVVCRSGMRSAKAIELLSGYQMGNWLNLRGGINALACETSAGLSAY
jgi:rhodanese-related sulfurtransferase